MAVAVASGLLLALGLQSPAGAGTAAPPFPMSLHGRRCASSGAARRTAALLHVSGLWLQNPPLEPYGKAGLCQTVWPVLFVFLFMFNAFVANWRRSPQQLSCEHVAREGRRYTCMEDAAGNAWFPSSAPEGVLGATPAISTSVTLQPVLPSYGC